MRVQVDFLLKFQYYNYLIYVNEFLTIKKCQKPRPQGGSQPRIEWTYAEGTGTNGRRSHNALGGKPNAEVEVSESLRTLAESGTCSQK